MVLVKPYPHPDDWMKEGPDAPLQEMASSPDKVEQKLTQFHGTILTHLLKLFYFRDFTDYFQSWTTAVFKSAFYVSKLSSPPRLKNKLPPAQMIYDWMWGDPWDDVFDNLHDGFIKDANYKTNPEYQDLPYIHAGGNEKNAGSFIKYYHLWLAKELSKNGRVSLSDVQDEIKLLFRKYPV
jgi:hypothetical protein